MLRWWSLAASIAVFLLLMFFAASAAGIAMLEDPTPLFRGARPVAAVIGVSLLVADVFLPVPSSLVMVAHGTLFGVVGGTLLSLIGSIASALVGFAVGRAGTGTIRRFVSERQHERAAAMLTRWGVVAIAVTRPVPILAETVAILAGSSPLRWRDAALAAAAGSLAPAMIYAWAGAHVETAANHALIFGGVLLVTAILWWAGRGRSMSILVLLLLSFPSLAEETPKPVLRGEIVVTPERGAVERDAVAASVSVLTREELDAMPAQSLAEVVSRVPGITMYFDDASAGTPMVVARGFFGGGENEYVKVLVDGIPVGDVESGLIDWRHLRVANIERVELLRGPGSSLYGDTAIGGVISLFTRGAVAGNDERAEVRLSAGTLGTHGADLFYRGDLGPLRLGIAALTTSTTGYRDHSRSRDRGAELTLQRLSETSRLQLAAARSSMDREEPGPLLATERAIDREASNAAFRFDREQSERDRLAVSYDTFGALSLRVVLHLNDRTTERPRTLLLAPDFGSTLLKEIRTTNSGGIFEVARAWVNASVRAGADLDRASLHGSYSSLDDAGQSGATVALLAVRRDQTAFFATADWQPLDRIRFSAGLRRDDIRDHDSGNDRRKSAWSPRAGVTFRLGAAGDASAVIAFVQLAHAFKAPTLDQLFDPRPFPGPDGASFTVSNPSLLPQRARNAEVGLSRNAPSASWSVSAYRTNVTDEIDFDPTYFTYRNIGSSRHTGLEARIELRTTPFVKPELTYAWTRVVATDNPDQQLKNIPEHVAGLFLRASLPRSTGVSLGYRWEHARFADDDGRFPLPDVQTVNAKIDRSFGRVRVELEARNLLDEKYSYVASILNDFAGQPNVLEFPAPGRTVRVNVAWRY